MRMSLTWATGSVSQRRNRLRPRPVARWIVRSGPESLGRDGLGQPVVDQAAQGPIDERAANSEDAPDVGGGSQLLGQGKSVARSLGEDSEDRILGHGELA